jgi:hypothetical protein
VKRRAVLASLGAAVGLAGCAALSGDRERTLTPAPVPEEATPRAELPETDTQSLDCPELPADADSYVCSPEAAGGLALRQVAAAYRGDIAGFVFTLANDTDRVFETGRDRWLVAQQTEDGWLTIDAGGTSADLSLAPGEQFSWVVGPTVPAAAPSGASRVDTEFGSGPHAFIVTGRSGGGLAAVLAPFDVPRGGSGPGGRS